MQQAFFPVFLLRSLALSSAFPNYLIHRIFYKNVKNLTNPEIELSQAQTTFKIQTDSPYCKSRAKGNSWFYTKYLPSPLTFFLTIIEKKIKSLQCDEKEFF